MSKKVLFLARLYHPHMGGVETHVYQLVKVLKRQGYDLTILTEQYDPVLPESSVLDGVKIIRIPFSLLRDKKSLWWWVIQHYSLFSQADVIHIHDVFWWLLPISPFFRHKSFITFHGYEGSEAPNWRQIFWHRLGALMTSGNICIGGFHEKWYGVKPSVISFGAVEFTVKKSKEKVKLEKRIAFVGRLAEDVGIMIYLKGFAQLVRTEPGWKLDIYGDGPQLSECRSFVAKHDLPVNFLGWVPNASDQLAAHSLVYVSRYLGIIESLAQGKRVVAVYNNQIKFDYLTLSPFANWIEIVSSPQDVARATLCAAPPPSKAENWATAQSWEVMADAYRSLWSGDIISLSSVEIEFLRN